MFLAASAPIPVGKRLRSTLARQHDRRDRHTTAVSHGLRNALVDRAQRCAGLMNRTHIFCNPLIRLTIHHFRVHVQELVMVDLDSNCIRSTQALPRLPAQPAGLLWNELRDILERRTVRNKTFFSIALLSLAY